MWLYLVLSLELDDVYLKFTRYRKTQSKARVNYDIVQSKANSMRIKSTPI